MDEDHPIVLLPAAALQQDACIIAEQPDHLVLSIRIPKSKVLSNHPLLMALAERAGETLRENPLPSPPNPNPSKKKTKRRLRYAVAIVLIPMLSLLFFGNSFAGIGPGHRYPDRMRPVKPLPRAPNTSTAPEKADRIWI
jgi:hypothetical protein